MEVPAGAKSLDVAIGNVSDNAADLDLTVYDSKGAQVAQSADGDSEEAVSIASPAAGTYTIEVVGYSVPSGSTAYDYQDVFFSSALGTVTAHLYSAAHPSAMNKEFVAAYKKAFNNRPGFMAVGVAIIVWNYMRGDSADPTILFVGLGLIAVGFALATRWR